MITSPLSADATQVLDLVVTADAQGGITTVLAVKTAAAASNPALAAIQLTAAAPGLSLSTDAAGNLAVGEGPQASPVFSGQAPQMWDSAPPPPGTATTTGPDGTTVVNGNGLPAYSSLTGPGVGAHTATVPLSASGNTITLSPPASVLTGPSTVYPVYVDPTIYPDPLPASARAWTQVDSGKTR